MLAVPNCYRGNRTETLLGGFPLVRGQQGKMIIYFKRARNIWHEFEGKGISLELRETLTNQFREKGKKIKFCRG